MSDTDSTRVVFGRNAVLDKSETQTTTVAGPASKSAYYMKVKAGSSKEVASIYVNTDTEKRRSAYQTVNRILAEG